MLEDRNFVAVKQFSESGLIILCGNMKQFNIRYSLVIVQIC